MSRDFSTEPKTIDEARGSLENRLRALKLPASSAAYGDEVDELIQAVFRVCRDAAVELEDDNSAASDLVVAIDALAERVK